MRLIDAEIMEKHIMESKVFNQYFKELVQPLIWVENTIEAEPVKRGKWVMDTYPDDGDCRCSNCKVCIDALHRRNHNLLEVLGYKLNTFYSYCPNCGAKMECDT